jgi:hypothetical protein
MNSALPPSQRARCACAAAGSFSSSSFAASRACSISATSRSRSAKAQQRHARLPGAQEFAGTADQQVLARDLEAVGILENNLEAHFCDIAYRLSNSRMHVDSAAPRPTRPRN